PPARPTSGTAFAQPVATPSPTTSAPHVGTSSISAAGHKPKSDAGSLICDFSGNICVPAGKASASTRSAKVSMGPAAASTPQASQPAASKPAVVAERLTNSAHQLICDPSGKVCVDSSATPVHSAQLSGG